ncbi:L-aspartate oxidase [Psychrobacter sp. NZS113]|uniref:L-aspartate oxidase n=1 Tax=Psychrobacter sp. NZS113 TaxID=2792045 RepID=UPI0018CCF2EC|nr:L-aspartate oxidase [Psychrobacter sp. NZS113]MBH0096370.1 L-aspartate oxidase [Psychrobacter sp. NZS113]
MSADNVRQTDVLIIGAGLAGLSTALSLPESLSIMVLSKAALEVCSSHYAQGGIAASLDQNDSVTDHVADTLIAGAGLCDANNTTEILSEGQQAIQWLCEQGVPFTQNPQQDVTQKTLTDLNSADLNSTDLEISSLHLTKEGGHGCRRVAHADDATGRHVMEALTIRAHAASNITILPYHEALSLLKDPITNSHCKGARVFDHNNHRQLTIYSRAVVLASGGLGQLFQRASAPNVCVGDGVMMAWQAGCRLANLEFVQFHPTGLALGDSSFLISEALRGEGGRLYCPQTGRRFMLDVDERAELAPRDIVARAIAEQISVNGLGYVHLDVSHLPAPFLQEHFPQIYQTLLALGIDITTDPIPVAPTAHYSCGGVVTSVNGMTDVAGLYAAGEVAHTGLHGANRLASNSLLECVVVGRNIATDLPRYLAEMEALDAKLDINLHTTAYHFNLNASADDIWTAPVLKNTQSITLPYFALSIPTLYEHNKATKHCHTDADMTEVIVKLKALMTTNMGITRSARELEEALEQIQQWQQWLKQPELSSLSSSDSNSNANRKNSTVSIDELTNLQLARQLQLATLIIQSASQRLESRGGHYRKDYPNLAVTPRTSVINPLLDPREASIDWLIQPIIVHSGARTIKATTTT